LQSDDLVTAQRLEEWLEAAGDQAAHERAVEVDLADAGRSLDLPYGGRAHEADLNSLDWMLCDHAPEPREHAARCHP
jgi:hypothetical protein